MTYCTAMTSVGEGCIDDKGVPIVDVRKKKIILASKGGGTGGGGIGSAAASGGVGGGGGIHNSNNSGGTTTTAATTTTTSTSTNIHANVVDPMSLIQQQQSHRRGGGVSSSSSSTMTTTTTDYYHTENCGLIIQEMANTALSIATRYTEFIVFVNEGILPELTIWVERMKVEIGIMEKLGNSIMAELEGAEEEVCKVGGGSIIY